MMKMMTWMGEKSPSGQRRLLPILITTSSYSVLLRSGVVPDDPFLDADRQ